MPPAQSSLPARDTPYSALGAVRNLSSGSHARALTRCAALQMAAPKRARGGKSDPAAGGVGAPLPPPPPRRTRGAIAAARAPDPAYERRLKLTDIIGYVALNGYAREAEVCAGLNRETWRCVPAGLSAADAERVRAGHPLWRAIIDLPYGLGKQSRLMWAANFNWLSCVRSLCDWHAGLEVRDAYGWMALHLASYYGRTDCVRELIARGADVNAISDRGTTSLMCASWYGHVDTVRLLLAAGADKRRIDAEGRTAGAHSVAGGSSRDKAAAIRALLDAAP